MSETRNATPAEMLERRITDPCIPKSEAEWWAHREIERLRAENERLRETLKIAASYVNSCYHEWYRPHDLAEALRDLTKIREVLNDERAGELEAKP